VRLRGTAIRIKASIAGQSDIHVRSSRVCSVL
jgi:hypothetical protein